MDLMLSELGPFGCINSISLWFNWGHEHISSCTCFNEKKLLVENN